MIIEQFGTHKSGSMLIFKCLKYLFEATYTVHKKHLPLKQFPNRKIVCTVRDFRDSAVSYFVALNPKAKSLMLTKRDCKAAHDLIRGEIDHLNRYKKRIDSGNILLLRYRLFYHDFNYIFTNIEKFFNIKIKEPQRTYMRERYNFGEHKRICDRLHGWKHEDSANLMRGNHCQFGTTGTWKAFVRPEWKEYITRLFKDDLILWGYKI